MTTKNELVLDAQSVAELAQEMGASAANGNGATNASRLPQLVIESQVDDEHGNTLPRGHFFIKGLEETAYAEKVTIRPLQHGFQYLHWDKVANKLAAKSLIIANFGQEPRDTNGTVRCGKPVSSELRELSPEQREKYDGITCFRQVRALASFTGKTLAGKEVTYENQPVILMLKGTNFLPFESEYMKAIPRDRNIWDFNVEVTSKRHKNGSVTWFTMHFKPDLKNPLPLDETVLESIRVIRDAIRSENARIDKAYEAALRNESIDRAALDAIEGSLDDDLVDAA